MSASPSFQQPPGSNEDERHGGSPYFPRISGANTVARPSPMQTGTEDAFPTVKLQAKMVKQTPLPYQTQEFRPCILLKKFEPSVRVSDSFVPGIPADEALGEFKKKRTVILHTDRYTQLGQIKLDADSQKVRLAQEGQMLQDARSRMRLREALAHRARHDLHLGGSPLQAGAEDSARMPEEAATAEQRSKKSKQRRRRRRDQQQQQQQQPMKLGLIPEEIYDSTGHHRRYGQTTMSQSSLQQRPAAADGVGQSFASRAEFDALAALIGAQSASAAAAHELPIGGFGGSGGLEKVKLDGSKAVFNRRSDILAEIARLKAIVLPDFAKDLYVGRGIRLPESHGLNNPKKTLVADDPILDALLHRAQQPSRIIDEAGNILIASSGVGGSQPKRQVFAADVTVKPNPASDNETKPPAAGTDQYQQLESLEDEDQNQQQQQQQAKQPIQSETKGAPSTVEESIEQLPEPFLGLPSEWMRSGEQGADKETGGDAASIQEQIKQQELPQIVTGYLLAILAASNHARAGPLTLELGRLIGQRLKASQNALSESGGLNRWLRRGLDLFHDVDREAKGSVSLTAFLDILSSMRGMPLDNEEMARLQASFGLSGDSISKLAFLTVLPFLQDLLNKSAA